MNDSKLSISAKKKFQCDACQYSANQKIHLQRHVRRVHGGLHSSSSYTCTFCQQKFEKRIQLLRHRKIVHKVNHCKLCDYIGKDETVLKIHVKRVHDKIKDFKCDVCQAEFSQKIHLQRHGKRIHKDFKRYK